MSMKEAFDTFFAEMDRNSLENTGKLTRIPYKEGYVSKELIILDTLDDEGYAVWRPQLQTEPVSFDDIEKELDFEIHPQLKEYLTTYWFRSIEARVNLEKHSLIIELNAVLPGISMNKWLKNMLASEETHYLSDHVYFLLGTYCAVDEFDDYLVEFNNDTGEVTDRVSIKLAGSIEELLKMMKGIW